MAEPDDRDPAPIEYLRLERRSRGDVWPMALATMASYRAQSGGSSIFSTASTDSFLAERCSIATPVVRVRLFAAVGGEPRLPTLSAAPREHRSYLLRNE